MVHIEFIDRAGVLKGIIECDPSALRNPQSWVCEDALPLHENTIWHVRLSDADRLRRRAILRAAYSRGFSALTFATAEEVATPGYDAAWRLGRSSVDGTRAVEPHMLFACGCDRCRFERIIERGDS